MKKVFLACMLLCTAVLLSGADLVLKDFNGKKVTGTVKWAKKQGGILLIQGEMQGGEIRLPIPAALLKQYKFIVVDRRHQSGEWQVGWMNKDAREVWLLECVPAVAEGRVTPEECWRRVMALNPFGE